MKIIYISGIDGCGKTTQAKLLVNALNESGINAEYAWLRWEPSFQLILKFMRSVVAIFRSKNVGKSEAINRCIDDKNWVNFKRKILSKRPIVQIWLFVSSADYWFSYKKQVKKLKCDVAVFDRYVIDYIIDQAINIDLPPERMNPIREACLLNKFRAPDYMVIINIPATEGFFRKNDGTSPDYLESRERYYRLLSGRNTLHLDGLDSIDILHGKIREWVSQRIRVEGHD